MSDATLVRERPHSELASRSRRSSDLMLARRADGRLTVLRGDVGCPVEVRAAFPWSEPSRFLSLRDDDEKEVAMVEDARELDAASRQALEDELVVVGFVFEVTRVLAIEEEVEVRCWRVETNQGPRLFQTRLDEWPRELPHGGLLVRDVAGDQYLVRDPEALDPKSRDLLWVFVD